METSDLRLDLQRRICNAVMATERRHPWKRELAETLAALPFERMGDRALLEVARRYVPEADVERSLWMLSAVRYDVQELTYSCGSCCDSHVIEIEPGRFGRCPSCNRIPEPV